MRKFLFTFIVLFTSLTGFGQLLSEGFDDITTLGPAGWTMTNQSNPVGTTNWFQGNATVFPSHSGADTSYIGANFNNTSGAGTISNWLITPTLNVKDGDKLSFWTRTSTGSIWNDRLEVRMSQGTMTLPTGASGIGSFTTVMTIINDGYNLSYPEVWTKYELTVSGIGSSPTAANFAFRYNVVNGGPSGTDSNYIGIDDVLVEEGGGGGGPFPDPYCDVEFPSDVEPISRVVFNTIDNSSDPTVNGSPALEDFTAVTTNIDAGQTYAVAVEGNTNGPFTTYVTVYIDYDQSGTFEESERTNIGTIYNSSGTDGVQATGNIAIPSDATAGPTRMRVLKKWGGYVTDPCNTTGYGQAEDYTVNIGGGAGGPCNWTVHVWDNYWGDEVEWELRNSGGTVLISGGPYGSTYDDTQSVSDEGPVTFWITNEGVINDNTPNYEVSNDNGVVISGQLTTPTTETFSDLKCSDGGGTGGDCDYELFTESAGDPGNFFNSFAGVTFDMQNSGTDDLTITGFKVPVTGGSTLDIDIYYTTTASSNVGVQSDPSAWTLLDSLTGISAIEAVAWDVNTFTQVTLNNTLTLAPGESKGFYVFVTNYSTGITYHYTNGNFTATDGYLTILSNGFGSSDVLFSNSFADRAFVGEVQYSGACTEPPTGDCPIEYEGDFVDGLGNLATGIILAADFPVPTGETWNLGDVKVQLLYETSSVEISFYQDGGGQPGTQIFAPTVVTPVSQTIVGNASGTDIYEVVLDMSSYNISLTGGMYWMGITTNAPGGLSYWHYTETVNNGTNFFGSLDGYATWEDVANYGFFVDGAFSICTSTTPPVGDCEQDFYTTEDPISGAGFSSGNWVANDVIVAGDTQFTMQTMTFETVTLSGNPTNFDLEIFEDNGTGGVGASTGMTYHFDSSNMTYTPNGLLFGVYPQYTVVFDLPAILLQANGSADTRYWLAVTSDLSSTGDFTYWVSYLHSFTPIPESNPTWQYLASDGVWAQYDSSGPNEGYMKVEGQCETLGISDLTSFDFAYYPNPVRDVLNITSQKAVKTVEAFNMTGQKVLSTNKVINGQIDVNALSPGVYVFKAVLEGGQVETFKIIKK